MTWTENVINDNDTRHQQRQDHRSKGRDDAEISCQRVCKQIPDRTSAQSKPDEVALQWFPSDRFSTTDQETSSRHIPYLNIATSSGVYQLVMVAADRREGRRAPLLFWLCVTLRSAGYLKDNTPEPET